MPVLALTVNDVEKLRAISNGFGGTFSQQKKQFLQSFSKQVISDSTTLKQYHDCLLFLIAYPENVELLALAESELKRVGEAAKQIANGKSGLKQKQLFGSGIIHTKLQAAFTFDLVKWLANTYPKSVSFNSFGAEKDKVREILSLCLPVCEREVVEDSKLSIHNWIKKAKGNSPLTDLQWIIALIDNAGFAVDVKDTLYTTLALYIDVNVAADTYSRTFGRSVTKSTFYHTDELIKKVNALELISKQVPLPQKTTSLQTKQMIEVARMSLCLLYRETDPVTYTNEKEVLLFNMGRGIDICLYGIKPEKRKAIDSYIGYMAFKNGVPCAYGGGWILQDHSKIGVNIYPPFRGGESAYLFCQILRLYHRYFNVSCISVEPYQIGKNNSEGVKSGAFWFYYKLGFRPMEAKLKQLAEKEFALIASQKGYRTSLNVLKQLANANLEIHIGKGTHNPTRYTSHDLSKIVTHNIAKKYAGNREVAKTKSFERMKKALGVKSISSWTIGEQQSFKQLSLLMDAIPDIEKWNAKNKNSLLQLMKAKGGDSEIEYIRLFQQHPELKSAFK